MSIDLLGRAESYTTLATGPTPDTISNNLRWNNISWGRTLSTPSSARVICPLADIVDWNGVLLKDWSHGLQVLRNDEEVWWGPIRDIDNAPGSDMVTITAVDAMGLTAKRELQNDEQFDDVDISVVFEWLLEQAGDLRGLTWDVPFGDIRVARNYQQSDYRLIEEHFNEFNRTVQWAVVNHVLRVIANTNRLVFGTFTDSAFVERPGFTLSGDDRANEVVIPGGGNGEAGFARAWRATGETGPEGRLTRIVNADFYRPVEGLDYDWDPFFSAMARQMVEAWSGLPIVIQGSPLSPEAPVRINNMIPGTIWELAIMQDQLPWLSTQQILESIEVDVNDNNGITETISPTLIPPSELFLTI